MFPEFGKCSVPRLGEIASIRLRSPSKGKPARMQPGGRRDIDGAQNKYKIVKYWEGRREDRLKSNRAGKYEGASGTHEAGKSIGYKKQLVGSKNPFRREIAKVR